MRWLDDVSMELRKIGVNEWRESKESRGLEAYCTGGQGPPRVVAPSEGGGGGHLHVECPLFLSNFNETGIFSTDFSK